MRRITLLFTLLGLFANTILAHDNERYSREDKWHGNPPQRDVWVEGTVEYPASPRQENLLEYGIPNQKNNYRYLLDTESISVGDDGVVRYSIAIDSGNIRRSLAFEGIRCKTRMYITYAHGIRGENLQRRKKLAWRPIRQASGSISYRHHLAEELLCSGDGKPNTREQILQKLAAQ